MTALLTEQTAARRLAISANRLQKLVREGKVPHIELPDGSIRFDVQDLEDWLESRRRGETPLEIGAGSF